MKISLIQTSPQTDKAENLRITRGLMEDAVRTDSPDLIVLPEYFEYYGGTPDEKLAAAESVPDGPAYKMAQDFAREHKVFVHAGTLMEKVPNEKRIYNSTFVFNREGKEIAHYRKIHMFDIVGPDGTAYKESATVKPGENVVVYDLDGFKIGCAICYDIRFAELYLELEKAGADVIVLPAAFTLQTGKDHWEVLARARAIETQTYFAACGQTGSTVSNGERRHTYGHSLVCDPWGHVVARASDGVGFVTARIERAQIERVRSLIPMVSHRRIGKQLQACA
ncbi:carbon-nitrogen hydrolase family protein [Brucella tritici]|uniref:Carbon-nitrogen hydrolase family protein n=1 Tax=Brucella tritici TaxID=94626 RepID=A0A6N6Q9L8_9HYPH|nr:carbon-nitrogen hydrolase family protein [Brucella tritici]KAB2671652.1 carbon-nitrogen hydrolase family protein [Brucella tritici]KAB2678855.1 carbon-nitrogen hydrolase family protein [Brucella tritici]